MMFNCLCETSLQSMRMRYSLNEADGHSVYADFDKNTLQCTCLCIILGYWINTAVKLQI